MATDYRKKGYKQVAVWIPADLHEALRMKLFRDGSNYMRAMTRLLELYTGHKVEKNEATGKPDEPTAG